MQPSNYKDSKLIVQRLRELNAEGKTSDLTNQLLFAPERPLEELYVYKDDKWQLQNLAANPELAPVLREHRQHLRDWIKRTGDPGPETPEVYDLEINDQLRSMKKSSAGYKAYSANAENYRKWAKTRPHIDLE